MSFSACWLTADFQKSQHLTGLICEKRKQKENVQAVCPNQFFCRYVPNTESEKRFKNKVR